MSVFTNTTINFSDELKVIWFTPPRTATRSSESIQKYFNFDMTGMHGVNVPKGKEDYFFIYNIRNPYSRLVSIYRLFRKYHKIETNDFKLWATKKLIEEKESSVNVIYDYQIYLTKYKSYFPKSPDYFVRFENLESDIRNLWFIKDNMSDELEKVLQENIILNNFKTECGGENNWQEQYDDELKEYVYHHLKDDFELFNYNKEF